MQPTDAPGVRPCPLTAPGLLPVADYLTRKLLPGEDRIGRHQEPPGFLNCLRVRERGRTSEELKPSILTPWRRDGATMTRDAEVYTQKSRRGLGDLEAEKC
ncbi:hypothetical protein NDU88_004635 [Pleurodeles waltl]|uniref:Uncharacterized protein n=1 Tax=Pleurodeles waltl TaxID=8319 RepID=A0AAV7SJH3_PLEWA|nr:hypothetical protein NDU88_004635 [Pleurodeles waltl]